MFGKKKQKAVEEAQEAAPAKPSRTVDDVRKDYSSLCARAGHLQYQIDTIGKDLTLVNDQLRELNFEAAKIAADAPKPATAEGAANVG